MQQSKQSEREIFSRKKSLTFLNDFVRSYNYNRKQADHINNTDAEVARALLKVYEKHLAASQVDPYNVFACYYPEIQGCGVWDLNAKTIREHLLKLQQSGMITLHQDSAIFLDSNTSRPVYVSFTQELLFILCSTFNH